jgi:type I restriction enzyme M protein
MLTGEIRNKVDKLWSDIWAGGISNPLTVIEQLTYLIFIRSLDEKELQNESNEVLSGEVMPKIFPKDEDGQDIRWSKFKTKDPRIIYEVVGKKVFPFIKTMNGANTTAFSRYMQDAMFLVPTPHLLQKIITSIDELYKHDIKDLELQGDLYEYMLGKLASAGQNGQFSTPKHIRDMMVRLLAPTPNDKICDPACGTAGFLVSTSKYIRENFEAQMTCEQWDHFSGEMFSGFDTDRTMLRLSAMNLILHSINQPQIDLVDSISKHSSISSAYDIVLANPPFSGTVDAESINNNLMSVCDTKKTELLFVALYLRILRKGGRCACIVPSGVLFGSTHAHKALRQELVENHQLQAVISMPSGIFKPYAGVSTAVLIFTKTGTGGTDKVWFYDMKADGFSLDNKRAPIIANNIPDILARFHNLHGEVDRKPTEPSFLVDKAMIVANEYDLSINKYKEVVYEKVKYDKTDVIIARLEGLNLDISLKLGELRGLLGE